MSVRASSATVPAAPPPHAAAFWKRFVKDAHVLVAEGFSRLTPAALEAEDEERISQRIKAGVDAWFGDPSVPSWTRFYFVQAEMRLGEGALGKQSPRIDIYIENSERQGARARFLFEAKRFYRSDSVAEYVGPKGLGAFLDGTYAREARGAGMLGYVQKDPNARAIEKVKEKLQNERKAHGLASSGAVWSSENFHPAFGDTFVSQHKRKKPLSPIALYHSFLRCCP